MKLITKSNLHAMLILLSIIIFSQLNLFDFLLNSCFGRLILLIALFILSNKNGHLGLFIVLMCIVLLPVDSFVIEDFSNINDNEHQPKKTEKHFNSIEGFDLLGIESTLQRGKKSSCVPINSDAFSFNNVSPSFPISLNYSNF